jgi:hypothetical protein
MVNSAPHDSRRSASPGAGAPRRPSITFMLLVAAAVAAVAGLLSHAAGNNVPGAVLTGGAAFGGAFGLLLAVAHYAETGAG